jgi:3-keto-disaccharide hydrolase/VCBS repeat protein
MSRLIRLSFIIALCTAGFERTSHANKNFVPDWTFTGSSLSDTEQLGDARWTAQNGEVIAMPSSPDGGWLLFDRPIQDVQMAASFRCVAGCQAGLVLRLEKITDGFKGVLISISDAPAAFAVTLDAQGRFRTREPLERGGGTVRALAPPQPPASPDAARAGGPGRGGPGRGAGAGRGAIGPPERSPYVRPDYVFRPGEWNTLESILDANILRSWLNDGPEAGVASGRVDDQVARYGKVGLYVGGTAEVRYRSIETKDLGRRVFADEQVGAAFRLQRLNDFYYAWSATAGDVNRDGVLDVIAGPQYFLGPDYRVSREIYVSRIYNPGAEYAAGAMNIAHDYTGDGFPEVVVSEGRSFVMYVNPGKELRRWHRYPAFANTAEVVAFHDVTGDGAPDVIVLNSGMVSVATVNKADPTSPWTVRAVSGPGYTVAAQHGLGAGDINGDGRVDVVTPYGWWEQPASGFGGLPAEAQGAKAGPWSYHPVAFGRWPRAGASPGGGELRVADLNGDGLNDVVASLEAHGWGLAWFEQKRTATGETSWVQHIIIDDLASKNPGGVAISELHAITTADVDNDGVTDVIAGKRLFSHLDSYTDPDPHGDAVLYVFRTVRDKRAPGGATFVPQLVHNRSGVGSMVQTADLNKDGAVDILTATDRGTFIFWGTAKKGTRTK